MKKRVPLRYRALPSLAAMSLGQDHSWTPWSVSLMGMTTSPIAVRAESPSRSVRRVLVAIFLPTLVSSGRMGTGPTECSGPLTRTMLSSEPSLTLRRCFFPRAATAMQRTTVSSARLILLASHRFSSPTVAGVSKLMTCSLASSLPLASLNRIHLFLLSWVSEYWRRVAFAGDFGSDKATFLFFTETTTKKLGAVRAGPPTSHIAHTPLAELGPQRPATQLLRRTLCWVASIKARAVLFQVRPAHFEERGTVLLPAAAALPRAADTILLSFFANRAGLLGCY